jgi:hypothetical protein
VQGEISPGDYLVAFKADSWEQGRRALAEGLAQALRKFKKN